MPDPDLIVLKLDRAKTLLAEARDETDAKRALDIARTINHDRRWGDLGILADALEEADCPAEVPCQSCEGRGGKRGVGCVWCHNTGRVPNPLLAHLRSPGPHARGCWTLDLLLGKE